MLFKWIKVECSPWEAIDEYRKLRKQGCKVKLLYDDELNPYGYKYKNQK